MAWLPAALGAMFVLAAGGVLATAVALVAVILMPRGPLVEIPQRPPAPPTWVLDLPAGLPPSPVDELCRAGPAAVEARDYRKGLESFYRALVADPGNPYAERWSYAAGELLVLESLDSHVTAVATARAARAVARDALLAEAEDRRPTTRRAARERLEAEFGDDPVARAALDLPPSPGQTALMAKADAAAKAAAKKDFSSALSLYLEVLADVDDPTLRTRALAGAEMSRHELARSVAADWLLGVQAEIYGRDDEARTYLGQVVRRSPDHPSARRRLERLGGGQ